MEYVQGESITTHANRKRLDVPARLELFRDVCAAVAHAHRSLVIHRDLKPANVMVQDDDRGHPAVKLLDFGIARIIAEELGDAPHDNEHCRPSDAVTPPPTGTDSPAPESPDNAERLLAPGQHTTQQTRSGPAPLHHQGKC